jgi:hypothetical protein
MLTRARRWKAATHREEQHPVLEHGGQSQQEIQTPQRLVDDRPLAAGHDLHAAGRDHTGVYGRVGRPPGGPS